MNRIAWNTVRASALALVALVLFACEARMQGGAEPGSAADRLSSAPRADAGADVPLGDERDAHITVLLPASSSGAWPTGLDPATSTTGTANATLMNAVFGGLFQLEPKGETFAVTGELAERYVLRDDGRTLEIHLRPGVMFSDGTPLDADALAWNIRRALNALCVCAPTAWPWAESDPVTVIDEHTVALHFARPYPAAVHGLPTMNINWPVSRTALAASGPDRFKLAPVGAGPFRIVANDPGAQLVLERNPLYWRDGRPRLAGLTFRAIGSEQTAWLALRAGDAHVYEGVTSPALMRRASSDPRVVVTVQPPTAALFVQLNTRAAPFDRKAAREAIYWATDAQAIGRALFGEHYTRTRTFTAPGGLFHRSDVADYREYDPDAARARVDALGGLRFTLGTLRGSPIDRVATALQAQWAQVGIEAKIDSYDLPALVEVYGEGGWQATLQAAGSYDPESIGGASSRFRSDRPFSGVTDADLDAMLHAAASTSDEGERAALYDAISRHISTQAYAPFLFALPRAQLSVAGLEGAGLTTPIPAVLIDTAVLWHDVGFTE